MAVARKPNKRGNFERTARLSNRGWRVLCVVRTILIMKDQPDLLASASPQSGARESQLIRLIASVIYHYRGSDPILTRPDEHAALRKCLRFLTQNVTP